MPPTLGQTTYYELYVSAHFTSGACQDDKVNGVYKLSQTSNGTPILSNGKQYWARTSPTTLYLRWDRAHTQWIFDDDFHDVAVVAWHGVHAATRGSRTPQLGLHLSWKEGIMCTNRHPVTISIRATASALRLFCDHHMPGTIPYIMSARTCAQGPRTHSTVRLFVHHMEGSDVHHTPRRAQTRAAATRAVATAAALGTTSAAAAGAGRAPRAKLVGRLPPGRSRRP